MWYAAKVGQIVPFVRETHDGYWSREDAGYINIVRKTDAEIIEVTDLPTVTYETGPGYTLTVPLVMKPTYDLSIVSDEEIIKLRQSVKIKDVTKPYSDTLEFSHELIKLVLERIIK